jgi:hypothetical protein
MRHHLLTAAAAVALVAAAMVVFPAASTAQAPPMTGGYTKVIANLLELFSSVTRSAVRTFT